MTEIDLFADCEVEPPRQKHLWPGDAGYVYDSGAESWNVHQCLLSFENTSALYPPRQMDLPQVNVSAQDHCDIKLSLDETRELRELWNEHVKTYEEEHGSLPDLPKDRPEVPKPKEVVILEITEVNDALSRLIVKGKRLNLPQDIQFSKNCYSNVKELMARAGGKYSRNGFTFKDGTDTQDIRSRLMNGEELNDKKKFQFFATPKKLAELVRAQVTIHHDDLVLEPSAGHAALLYDIPKKQIHCCEFNEDNHMYLEDHGYTVKACDFLGYKPGAIYDVIVANPPFTKNQDIKHVRHMYSLLKDGGTISTIMATGWQDGNTKIRKEFREWIKTLDHDLENIAAGEFKESGTQVQTCLLVIRK